MVNLTFKTNTVVFLIFLAVVLVFFQGCAGGGAGDYVEHEKTGAFRLNIAWPGQPIPEEGAKLIPPGTNLIELSIDRPSGSNFIVTDIVYPVSQLTVGEIPEGRWIAMVKAYNSGKTTLYSQRKESFVIERNETTNSGSMPLGIAISGTTANPVFEPSTMDVPVGSAYLFQNWLQRDFNLNLNITGVSTQNFSLPGRDANYNFSQGSYTVNIIQDTRIASFALVEEPTVIGSGNVTYNAPLQPYWMKVGYFIPRNSNGANGVYCKRAAGDLPNNSDYYWRYLSGYATLSYVRGYSSGNFRTNCLYNSTYVQLELPLNAGFSQFRVKGSVGRYTRTPGVQSYLYLNGTMLQCLYTVNVNWPPTEFDLTHSYNAGDKLIFRATAYKSEDSNDEYGVEWSNVQIIGIP